MATGIIEMLLTALKFTIFGIPVIPVIAIVIIALFIYKLISNKPKELKAPDLDVKKMTRKDFDKYLKLNGWRRFYWRMLRIGINPIGRIISYSFENHEFKIKDGDKDKKVEIPIYLLKTIPNNFVFIRKILTELFGFGGERYVISGNVIDNFSNNNLIDQHDLILNIGTTFRSYNDIFYCEDFGRIIIHDISINMAFEQQTKKLVEFTPLMTLLEIEQAKVKFKSELFTKLEKERYRGEVEQYSKT